MIRFWISFALFALVTVGILSPQIGGPGTMETIIALIALSAVICALLTRWIRKQKFQTLIALLAVVIPQLLCWGLIPVIWNF